VPSAIIKKHLLCSGKNSLPNTRKKCLPDYGKIILPPTRLNTCIVSDYLLDIPYVSIVMPKRSGSTILVAAEYSMKKDLCEYMTLTTNGVSGYQERYAVCFEVESRETYDRVCI